MLVDLKEILAPAREGKYAVGHFNTFTAVMARSVIQAAEELNAPVIIGIEERQLELCPLEIFASYAIPMAERAKVPVAVHFDRAHSFDACMKAVEDQKAEATMNDLLAYEYYMKQHVDANVKGSVLSANLFPLCFQFRNDSLRLSNQVSKAILSLNSDGSLSDLSMRLFYQDISKKE